MKNRNSSSPILCAVSFLLVASPLLAQVETVGSNPTPTAPAATPAPVMSSVAAVPPAAKHTISYTVVAGDSLTSLAKKFNTTRKKLKALNNLTVSTIKPGQVLLVPSTKNSKSVTAAKTPKAKPHHTYLVAQPVQDFDIPASTFGSCPVPLPDEDTGPITSETEEKSAPVAKLVSPADLEAEAAKTRVAPKTTEPEIADNVTMPHATENKPASSNFRFPSLKLTNRPLSPNPMITTPSDDWANRFLQEARLLGNEGIEYDDDWRPPGESHSWTMDCSNTTRYLYKVTTGIQLPRTASDQYYYLHLQGKAWDVPQTAAGWADVNYLRENLKPGDLLFWENTYRPERQPPITHVMVFLGTNAKGQWIMAGSQSSRGGEHNRRNGGPDIYVFRPSQPCGGYTTWLGLVHHQGRFCAFGRPLDADRTKLAVAANN